MRSTTALAVRSSVTSSPAAPPRSTATIGATFLSPEATAILLGTLASSSIVSATRQSFDRCSQSRPFRSTRCASSSPSAPARSIAARSRVGQSKIGAAGVAHRADAEQRDIAVRAISSTLRIVETDISAARSLSLAAKTGACN